MQHGSQHFLGWDGSYDVAAWYVSEENMVSCVPFQAGQQFSKDLVQWHINKAARLQEKANASLQEKANKMIKHCESFFQKAKALNLDAANRFPLVLRGKVQPRNRTRTQPVTTEQGSQQHLLDLALTTPVGHPRLLLHGRQRIDKLNNEYANAYCNPQCEEYPKRMEMRNGNSHPPPCVGEYLEIGGMCGGLVEAVGSFSSYENYLTFLLHGSGGLGLKHPEDILECKGLTETDWKIANGRIWWALLSFPY